MATGLQDAFLDELRDSYDAERQLVRALPKLARAATSEPLRAAFTAHLEETRGHVRTLEQVFATLGHRPRGKHCNGVAGVIEEGNSIVEEDFDDRTMDACLIAAGQRSEHYEMAAYGTLVAWAQALGHREVVSLLEAILAEEKAADEKLSAIAESGVNQAAASAADGDDDADSERLTVRVKRMLGAGEAKRTAKAAAPAKRPATKRAAGNGRR